MPISLPLSPVQEKISIVRRQEVNDRQHTTA